METEIKEWYWKQGACRARGRIRIVAQRRRRFSQKTVKRGKRKRGCGHGEIKKEKVERGKKKRDPSGTPGKGRGA